MKIDYRDLKENRDELFRLRVAIQSKEPEKIIRRKPRAIEESNLLILDSVNRINKAINEGIWIIESSAGKRRIKYNAKTK